jgi:hypothetical protein
VIDIQNFGRPDMTKYVYDKVNDAYLEKDSRMFLCSDLLRNQLGGLLDQMKEGRALDVFTQKDFSQTGAARTMSIDVNRFFREILLKSLIDIPDIYRSIFKR